MSQEYWDITKKPWEKPPCEEIVANVTFAE